MNNMAAIFEVLSKNSDDVAEIVQRFGGVSNLIKAGPALFRIAMTIAKAKQPIEAAEQTSQLLTYYDEDTMERVKTFQKKYGLDVDGLVGNETWKKVEDLLK